MRLERKPWRVYQQDFSKPFPRLLCCNHPSSGRKAQAAEQTQPRHSWHSATACSKRTCLLKALPSSTSHPGWCFKIIFIFVALGPQPDVTPGVQSQLIGTERRLIDLAAPHPAHVAVMRWRKFVSVPRLPWLQAVWSHCPTGLDT